MTAQQVTPLTVSDVADWCAGTVTVDAAGDQGVALPTGRARYGDWVVPDGDGFAVLDPVTYRAAHEES